MNIQKGVIRIRKSKKNRQQHSGMFKLYLCLFYFSDIECHNHPCMHGGICTDDQKSGHTCHCPLGFTGLNCEIGIYILPTWQDI